ncbi:MAG: efflux RND transporter periplasmic adaptor subunit [Proteobacteria bacterium]|nr:efflux RND transporter periplasmic adaptor subunit [Pseudomonadota bacterium]
MSLKKIIKQAFFISIIAILVIVFIWFLLNIVFKKTAVPETPPSIIHDERGIIIPEQSPLRQFIKTEPIHLQLISSPFILPAVVEADPATMVKIIPPVAGRIMTLNKRLGDSVKANDILFTLDSGDFAAASSDVVRAQSALTLAKENYARQQRLSRSDISARRLLQEARNDYEQAQSELARATARLAALKQEIEPSTTNSSQLIVRSPLPGKVVELNGALGGYWNDTTAPIMIVADLSTVYIKASAQEKDLNHIYLGQDVEIIPDAYTSRLHAKVNYISALLNQASRTADIRMLFKNNQDEILKPNMFAKTVFLSQPHQGILLPLTTVIQRGFDAIVFVEVAPWQFEPRIVKTGTQIGNKTEVISGLNPNEKVVVRGGIVLND